MNISFNLNMVSPTNCMYIIDCSVPSSDMNSAHRLEDDVKIALAKISDDDTHYSNIASSIRTIKVGSYTDFMNVKDEIKKLKEVHEVNPLVLIYGHGHQTNGLLLPSGEFVNWTGLAGLLNDITILSNGELTVVAAFCYSYCLVELYKNKFNSRLPFSFYYGFVREVSSGDMEECTTRLITSFILDGAEYLNKPSPLLKCYSEYDHIKPIVSIALFLAKKPDELHKANPNLSGYISKGKLKYQLIPMLDMPAGMTRELFDKAIGSFLLTEELICSLMHDTDRRKLLLEDLRRSFDKL